MLSRFLSSRRRSTAFTLIELLIVVAIIAILAAIAVPNFLEAQTRSKVSRCAADMRSIRVALESYAVDHNIYPETDIGTTNITQAGVGLFRCTTPIAYISSVPRSPFREDKMGFAPPNLKNANKMNIYLYVRALKIGAASTRVDFSTVDPDYVIDRQVYLYAGAVITDNRRFAGFWELKSVGPNNIDDRDNTQVAPLGRTANDARIYDPTNGTVSDGDIVQYGDTQGFASQQNQ
ncbi:MAG: hypothetical protein Kow0059_05330 [Candidatus Sumerlaeia bacterium]